MYACTPSRTQESGACNPGFLPSSLVNATLSACKKYEGELLFWKPHVSGAAGSCPRGSDPRGHECLQGYLKQGWP